MTGIPHGSFLDHSLPVVFKKETTDQAAGAAGDFILPACCNRPAKKYFMNSEQLYSISSSTNRAYVKSPSGIFKIASPYTGTLSPIEIPEIPHRS